MSIKTIVCAFGGEDYELNALSSALSLTRANHAVLRIVHISPPPLMPDAMGIGAYASAAYGDGQLIDVMAADERQLARTAETLARDYCERYAVSFHAEPAPIALGQAQAVFSVSEGKARVQLPRHALASDLIVAGYDNQPDGDLEILVTGLFEAAQPVLAVPRNPGVVLSPTGYAKTIVVAWDGSRAASRALREAVPHLIHAEDVHLVRVRGDGDVLDTDADADVKAYLASHGVAAEFLYVDKGRGTVGQAILAQAADLRANLLVMGAYGHSHIGEMLWGGATDYVIKHTEIPLLLAH
jgi:nucleotide-binding universal stress UspA family protein